MFLPSPGEKAFPSSWDTGDSPRLQVTMEQGLWSQRKFWLYRPEPCDLRQGTVPVPLRAGGEVQVKLPV